MTICTDPFHVLMGLLSADAAGSCAAYFASNPVLRHISATEYGSIFLATCLLEAPFYLYLLKDLIPRASARLGAILLLNIITHPLVILGFPSFASAAGFNTLGMIVLAEGFAFAAEALVLNRLWRMSVRKAVLTSTLANLSSWGIGTLLWWMLLL